MKQRIEQQTAFVCEAETLLSMACCGRPTNNGIAIFSVYTPPQLRGRGYGTLCTAALTQRMLEKYQFCCLLADDANPTSNSIYQKIGYEYVGKMQLWERSCRK